jgi:hypothetical protein
LNTNSTIVTISIFQFSSIKNRFWAFRAMGASISALNNIPEISFVKLMGSGGKTGFSIWPNFGQYAIICCWASTEIAQNILKTNKAILAFYEKSAQSQTVFLDTISSHGLWDGVNPFQGNNQKSEGRVAVITRGRIKTSKLWQFWKFVKPASHGLDQQEGIIYSVGIGELPIVQQATFSIWESAEKMKNYAYKSKQHTEVIQKTRELGWYSEELFARFAIIETSGNLKAFAKIEI